MHSQRTSSSTMGPWNISDAWPRFSSTSLASIIIRAALAFAVLSALLLIAALPAQAQTETVLYNFNYGPDNGGPLGDGPGSRLTFDRAGNLYGTTAGGGLGYGTVFELSPNGGSWNETVLYSFTGGADGAYPMNSYVIFDSAGNLYGTTEWGGANTCLPDYVANGCGVVFELSPVGTSWTETVLYNFTSDVTFHPENGLIMDQAGNLYGVTEANWIYKGGDYWQDASAYELSPSGGGWTLREISPYGSHGALTMDAAGNIFFLAWDVLVEELSPTSGTGYWNSTDIYAYSGFGSMGGTLVLDQAGDIYGTTRYTSAKNLYGAVYKLSPGTNGKWTKTIPHAFRGVPADGYYPYGAIVFDKAGDIYGTTLDGGTYGDGTVFELIPNDKGSYTEKIIWNFNGTDGSGPNGNLILDSAGNLYGTAGGGSYGGGVVFEVTPPAVKTKTTLTSSPNPSTYGQAVTFTATVTSRVGAPPDGETVSFEHNKTVLGTGALSGGSASFTTSTLKVGTTGVIAVYGGDSKFAVSKSNTVKQVVAAAGK